MKRNLYVFDFDGTLTRSDTLIEFIRFTHGKMRMLWGFALFSPLIVLMKLHLYSNHKAKEQLLCHFYGGMPAEEFRRLGNDFARREGMPLLRPKAVEYINGLSRKGEKMVIVSASVTTWVRPFVEHCFPKGADITVVGTELEERDGVIIGRYAGRNCYGAEKVERLKGIISRREDYYITAFGDSQGDKQMLDYADKAVYRPFRP